MPLADPAWGATASTFLHYGTNNSFVYFGWPTLDVSQWHDYAFTRRDHRITLTVDGNVIWDQQLSSTELPDAAKHPVFQQENSNYQPPTAAHTAYEEIQIQRVKLEIPG